MKPRFAPSLALLTAASCLALLSTVPLRAAQTPAPDIRVILWFDTEDYLLPADDDATKRLCQMLTERGVRATFKIVGEKARVLERRGRKDVIAALQRHEIAYHANFHSVHPTPTEYLADCGWLDGIEEFVRREGGGAKDVRRILSKRTLACYGQPGSSWAPQAIAALGQIGVAPHGVPCYVDEGTDVGWDGQPFWYDNALNVFHMSPNYTRMELHNEAAVEPGMRAVSEIAERLRGQGGGLISIFYHPCEWVHREFWDGVNFRRGANPPREHWKAPPQLPAEETEAAFQRFGRYIDHIRAIPGVRWVTAGDLPVLYPDRVRTEGASREDLAQVVAHVAGSSQAGLDVLRIGGRAYSVADQFELLTLAVNEWIAGREVHYPLKATGLFGPDSPPPSTPAPARLDGFAFRDTARDVAGFIQREHRVPARVFIGADPMAPADFLVALAHVAEAHGRDGRLPLGAGVDPGRQVEILPARRVANDTPDLFGDWIIHKEGFRAPKVVELARLQAWTLKPAIAAGASKP